MTQHDVDTEKAEADPTLVEIDQVVRDAVHNTIKCELDSKANQLIEKLANLETIRKLAAVHEPLPELGAYELLDELGRGGMGTVYRAKHRQLGKIQALKVIHSHSGLTPEIRARFRREVQAIGALKHPNIIAAHDADFQGDVPYLVMDYVEGESLAEVRKRLKSEGKTISVGAACELVRQAALGLQYAHDRKITHRDIKPGNLMLDGEGVVRILDLGLARLGAEEDASEHEATELTRGGQILGTPDYMSPEQLRSSRDVDARTDVYALGVTLFSLLAGSPVYRSQPGESFIAKASRILHEPVPNLRKLVPDVPKPLADIIAKCLAKSPDEPPSNGWRTSRGNFSVASPEEVRAIPPGYKVLHHRSSLPITPASPDGTKVERSKLPPRVLVGVAAAILIPLLIAAGVMLKLKLPGGGELIVDCDDPNAKIQVVAVKDGQREDLSLTREAGNKLRLSEGRWTILIEGVDAAQFALSENEIVINGETPASIRVTRRDSTVVEPPLVVQSHEAPGEVENATIAQSPNRGGATHGAPGQHIFDWSQLRPTGHFTGLVPSPEEHSKLWQSQIRPWLPQLTQNSHGLTENRIAIDPTGKYYAVISQYDCKIIELNSGAVTHTIPSPRDSRWAGVALTAGCQRVALLSENGGYVEIRDTRNRMVAQWNASQLIDGSSSHGAISWMTAGDQLVVWDDHKASVVDIQGQVQTSIEFEPEAGPEQDPSNPRMPVQRAVAPCAPDSQLIAYGCVDGRVRIWDTTTNTLRVLASERADEAIRAVHWSPDGRFLGALRAHQWAYGVALEIWSRDGVLKSTIDEEQLQVAHQSASEFAWSPDGLSLVLGSGRVVDHYGNSQRELKLLGEEREHGSPRITSAWVPAWSDNPEGSQRIDFVATGDTYGLQCGRVKSFTPTGRVLASSGFRNILQPQELSWIQDSGQLAAVFSHPDSSELRTWSIAGKPQSMVAIPKFVTGKIQSRSGKLLCFSGRKFSPLAVDRSGGELGIRTFDANFELGQWEWNHAGDRTTYSGKANGMGVVRLLNNSGDSLVDLQLPEAIANSGFSTSSGYLFWSPDDKYTTMTLLTADATQSVFV
ncbi:MAG: WD40 repeat domain-containing serine/threonine protein kinase [Pirellulaceae bacterium]